jgi:hypothetical protein
MANLLPILRTQFVLIKCQSSATSVFEAPELLYGMQGVRSSSLLGSILENTVVDRVFSGHMTAFFVLFCSPRTTWVVISQAVSAHNSAHREKSTPHG